jgi:hypothetical protein
MDYVDSGAVGGMSEWQRQRSTRRKPAPGPLWPPQIPHLACPGLEPGPPPRESGDYPPEPRHMHIRHFG